VFKIILRAKASGRVDFGGGTLDIDFFTKKEEGVTLNCGIMNQGYASYYPGKDYLTLESLDFEYLKKLKIRNKRDLLYNGELDLLKAAVKKCSTEKKCPIINGRIVTRTETPPGAGLSSSSAVSVAVLGLIKKAAGEKINNIKIAELAAALERDELKLSSGKQDQYAAALGGINFLRFRNGNVKVEKLNLERDKILELEKDLVLCYTGKRRVSADMNSAVIDGFLRGRKKVVDALYNIKKITIEMHKSLKKGDLEDFSYLLNQERLNRVKLHPSVMPKISEKFINIGLKNGAKAAKILGAGGGGCLLFYAKNEEEEKLERALSKAGATILDFKFDFHGLEVWKIS